MDDEVATAISKNLPQLIGLHLRNWEGRIGPEGVKSLATLSRLRSLWLHDYHLGMEALIGFCQSLTRLQSLDLRNFNKLQPSAILKPSAFEAILRLTRLRQLGLSGSQIGDEELMLFSNLSKLREIYFEFTTTDLAFMSGTPVVSSEGLSLLSSKLPHLWSLSFSVSHSRYLKSDDFQKIRKEHRKIHGVELELGIGLRRMLSGVITWND